jgi:transposase
MSIESANRLLTAAAQDEQIRDRFTTVSTQADFLQTSERLGYCFTATEFAEVIAAHSQGILRRRTTGVWRWLREINWQPQAAYWLRAEAAGQP